MGTNTIKLNCPLCCNETFDSIQSLKDHLLSIINYILCPACDKRFFTILELTEHLDSECGVIKTSAVEQVVIKIEQEDSNDGHFNTSILAKALSSPRGHTMTDTTVSIKDKVENDDNSENETEENEYEQVMEDSNENRATENGGNENEDVYACLSCGINFTSIVEHIQEYHEGEEVVVENNDDQNKDGSKNDEIFTELPDGTTIIANLTDENYEDEDDSRGSTDVMEMSNRNRMPQLLNTIKQEDCVDKDGRLYTRKVVQIEKFWDEPPPREPIILKYSVDSDGAVSRIGDDKEVDPGKQLLEIFQCDSCSVQFSKREQFDHHICDPEVASEYRCNKCSATFTNSQQLCTHMKMHKTGRRDVPVEPPPQGPYICNVCETIFPSNKSLRLHRRMHDPIKAKEIEAPVQYGLNGGEIESADQPRQMFVCKVCGKSYDKGYEDIHMQFHSGVNNYDCYICNRKFYTRSNLEMHMRVHGNEKGHLCPHCKKGFLTEETLQTHLKQHCSTRPYQCSYCSRRFGRPHEKVKHERIHTGEKPHECEICGKTFRVSYCLTLHMRTHSGYRPYVCKHCGKRFKAHSVYNHHLLTHSDVRNYKCPYCPKAFKTGVQLAGHKNSHTKPFSCTHCNRPFASLYAVRAHMETHKRDNNLKYNCYLCGASYARAFALRDHIKDIHVDAPQNGNISLDIIEEGMEASTSILPDNDDDISMVTLEMASEIEDDASGQ